MDTIKKRNDLNKNLGEAGFTFFEIAVSLAVLVIGIAGFLSVFSASLRMARDVKHDLTGPEAARTAAAYCVAANKMPAEDNPFDIEEPINGYYITVSAGRLDRFDLNVDDGEVSIPNVLDGGCNLNPSNADDYEFTMDVLSGGPVDCPPTVTRDDLHENVGREFIGINKYGGGLTYQATYIRFRPKGNGNSNTVTVNGEPYPVDNGKVYTFFAPASDPISVVLGNDKYGKNGKSMGHWWIEMDGNDVTFEENMDGGGDLAGDLLTLKVDIYENKFDQSEQQRSTGTYFIRMWYRK